MAENLSAKETLSPSSVLLLMNRDQQLRRSVSLGVSSAGDPVDDIGSGRCRPVEVSLLDWAPEGYGRPRGGADPPTKVRLFFFRRNQPIEFVSAPDLHRVAEVVRKAGEVWGNLTDASTFLQTEHPALGGKTPLAAASTSDGADAVLAVLTALEHGFPA